METLITFAGGLGLLFVGVKLLSAAIQQMAGRRLRKLLGRLTESYPATAALGFASGALTQNIGAVFFTLSGLVAADVVSLRRGADLLSWSYVGLSAILFVVTLDTRLFVLCVLGIAGVFYFFDLHQAERTRHLAAALLAAGLLMLGILVVGDAAAHIQETDWLRRFVALAGYHPVLAFGVGIVAGIIMPSLVSLSVVAVSLVSAGAIDFLTTCFLLTGGAAGYISTAPIYVARMDRATQMLAWFDLINRLLGVAVVTALLTLEWLRIAAPIGAATSYLAPDDIGLRCILLFVWLQVVSLTFALGLRDVGLVLATRCVRPSAVDDLAAPRHLPADARIDADTALDLAERELARIPTHLIDMVETVRRDPERTPDHPAPVLHAANQALAARVESFVHDVLDRNPSRGLLVRGSALIHRLHLLRDLTDSLHDFLGAVARADRHPQLVPSVENLVESLHMTMLSVHWVLASRSDAEADDSAGTSAEEIAALRDAAPLLTGDRAQAMKRLRSRRGGETADLDQSGQEALFDLTSAYDRLIWLLRRLLPQPEPGASAP